MGARGRRCKLARCKQRHDRSEDWTVFRSWTVDSDTDTRELLLMNCDLSHLENHCRDATGRREPRPDWNWRYRYLVPPRAVGGLAGTRHKGSAAAQKQIPALAQCFQGQGSPLRRGGWQLSPARKLASVTSGRQTTTTTATRATLALS